MRTIGAFAAGLMMLAACADPPEPTEEGPATGPAPSGVPDVAEIVCEADGSTTVLTPEVVVQPDGVHVHATSHLDETAEIVGLRNDIDPGVTVWVTTTAPGDVKVGCNPFSQHGSGVDPSTVPMHVLDPDGIYASGEVQCTGTASAMIGDFFEEPLDVGPVPLGTARAKIRGLEDDDQVFHAGYPQQADAAVAVRRNGQVVATFTFVTFDGEEWQMASNHICSSSELR